MNPYDCRVRLRPRSPLETLDLSIAVVSAWSATIGRLCLVLLLPAWLACTALLWIDERYALVAALLMGPLLQVPFTLAGAKLLFGSTPTLGRIFGLTWRVAGRAALIGVVQVLLLASSGCVGLGLFLMLPALFLSETLLLERVAIGRSSRRSMLLATESLGTSLVGVGMTLVLPIWFALSLELAAQGIVGGLLQLGEPFGSTQMGDLTPWLLAGMLLAQPAVALYRLLLYVDVRTKLEGWDLQVALKGAGQGT